MSRITVVIPPQNFEYVRNRVAEILDDEITNQVALGGDYEMDAEIYVERQKPFDESDLPAINVSIDTGSWANKHQGSSSGTYIINIDCFASSKTANGKRGDTNSALKSQRIAGLVRYILEDPQYKTLGFAPPYISGTMCTDMKFGNPNAVDANNQYISRIAFMVKVNETNVLKVPSLIEGYDTEAMIGTTYNGYQYSGDNE